ncbi:TRAP transporter large permease subunit [Tissierella carlieri]|jgi:C4-dicarboxylate transporter DctM subunit|uniref:TRAP transporter large permease subunit n=1 Tax=Tissierella carlieri TaxID=689904 RepID=A0ABT1SGK2_9FIRM|nr:TRAP transporter large permease subunit [Tissierella carlieri]MBU5312597.1 TRAP transporter large permease subunit [Tissierella carlieri]MCQ4925618.1 TRAP transporter large permease subunit [Tissierella carlieri]MDU5081693.1 TRAP transporter large permease subunit [Bacillota bacterium]
MTVALFVLLFVFLFTGAPVYIAMSLASVLALSFFTPIPMEVVAQRMFSGIDKFSLMAVPFFILAANVMKGGGISKRILNLASKLVGHLTGGLAIAVVISCMFFGAVSGSSPATVVAIGGLMLPELLKGGYGEKFSLGLITSSPAVAVIIPPSIGMIVYGTVTGVSVGDLFIGGIGPGIVWGLVVIAYCYFIAKKDKVPVQEKASLKEILIAFKEAAWALGVPFIIIGGIYGGIFTPTESAVVASVYAIFVAIFIYKQLDFKGLLDESIDAAVGTAQVMILLAAASIFSWILTRQQIPQALAEGLIAITNSKVTILLMMNIILLVAGMFIDPASATTILAPLFLPLAINYGIDPIHLGIIMVVNGAIGMFTPPFGLNLFVATGVSKEPVSKIISGIVPFVILSLITMAIVTYVPQVTMFFVNTMK